ncbi:MAG: hypothetical protein Q8L09_05390 [Candidatus Moranbacteria bacterium]|nr:hypothetical protein [Candidatus Moranbacteria bacterium]
MNQQHKNLAAGRWNELSFFEQMANVGSEVGRTIQWKKKNNTDYSQRAFERALELLDLTVADEKNRKRLRELLRVREALADHFVFDNIYKSTNQNWQNYFLAFNFAARINI